MIKHLRGYQVQENRGIKLPFMNVDRVNYTALLDGLKFPVIWAYDNMLEAWLPAEVDHAFIQWLHTCRYVIDLDNTPKGRVDQLFRLGLIEPDGRKSIEQLKTEMKSQGCVKINQLLCSSYCKDMLTNYWLRNEHLQERWPDMEGIKRTSSNNLPLMRLIHQATEKLVNSLIEEPIKTSYSFTSAYETGTCLPQHTDRPQCVWNISLMLGSNPTNADLGQWPIMINHQGTVHTIDIRHGDAVLYSGVRDLHWRDWMPPSITMALGVFFHYVPIDFTGSLD